MFQIKFLPSLLLFVCCAWAQESNWDAKGQGINDLTSSVTNIIIGLLKEVPKVKPSMDQLFRLPINALVGVPEVTFGEIFNQLCSIYLSSGEITPRITPNIEAMAFILGTTCRNESFPLLEAETILDSPNFNASKKLVLYVSGWKKIIEDGSAVALGKAFNCRDDYNFVYLDAANFIETLYTWSAYNTEKIGEYVARGLQKIVQRYPLENIHIIGHSLGSHIVGYTGRYFNKFTGRLIPHITGLDPANPCFNEGELLYGIQRGDAEFIDIIHTNTGFLGKKPPLGDADFYPGGVSPVQAGCVAIPCSHLRAWEYYAESVYPGNERNFLSVQCSSLTKLEDGFCDGEAFPMGFAVPPTLKGNYFLAVNKRTPYGKNASSTGAPSNSKCGSC